ncbi:MAG: hypothetical protein U9O20_02495 [Patescibacteria group bacterium]|nr:hypothetical protein [Patescibacteria group bacterium]
MGQKLVKLLGDVVNSGSNEEAKKHAEAALGYLRKIVHFDVQIKRVEQFIQDFETNKIHVQFRM